MINTLHQDVTRFSIGFNHIQQQIDTAHGDFIDRLLQGGQPGNSIAADIDSIETDYADIFRDGKTQILQARMAPTATVSLMEKSAVTSGCSEKKVRAAWYPAS